MYTTFYGLAIIFTHIPPTLIFASALWHRWGGYQHPCFIEEETEAQDGEMTFPRISHECQNKKANRSLLAPSLVFLPTNSPASLGQ